MQKLIYLAAAFVTLFAASHFAQAAQPCAQGNCAPTCGNAGAGGQGDYCNGCNPNGCGRCGHCCRHYIDGQDLSYNCGCQGSYKYPVPPQYTYHWPGMYSQRLMTDYHSPWRYPPIKPYTEEVKQQESKTISNQARLQRIDR